jgi:nucleoid DNA-binding protein
MKLPFFAKSSDAQPLMHVIQFVATRHGCSTYEVGLMMTSFFESLADEVSQGKAVTLPGFGKFAAVLIERKCDLARDPTPRCKPDFSPSVGFIQQVRTCAPPTPAGKRKLDRHRRRNHPSSRAGKSASRVFASSAAAREAIEAQLAGCDPFDN